MTTYAIGRWGISENTAMCAYPNSPRFVNKDAFSTYVYMAQAIFLIVISKGFSTWPERLVLSGVEGSRRVIFINALIRPKPKIAIFIFINSINRAVDKTIGIGKVGQRFYIIPHYAFAYGTKP